MSLNSKLKIITGIVVSAISSSLVLFNVIKTVDPASFLVLALTSAMVMLGLSFTIDNLYPESK